VTGSTGLRRSLYTKKVDEIVRDKNGKPVRDNNGKILLKTVTHKKEYEDAPFEGCETPPRDESYTYVGPVWDIDKYVYLAGAQKDAIDFAQQLIFRCDMSSFGDNVHLVPTYKWGGDTGPLSYTSVGSDEIPSHTWGDEGYPQNYTSEQGGRTCLFGGRFDIFTGPEYNGQVQMTLEARIGDGSWPTAGDSGGGSGGVIFSRKPSEPGTASAYEEGWGVEAAIPIGGKNFPIPQEGDEPIPVFPKEVDELGNVILESYCTWNPYMFGTLSCWKNGEMLPNFREVTKKFFNEDTGEVETKLEVHPTIYQMRPENLQYHRYGEDSGKYFLYVSPLEDPRFEDANGVYHPPQPDEIRYHCISGRRVTDRNLNYFRRHNR
jgi:hypothetical protein